MSSTRSVRRSDAGRQCCSASRPGPRVALALVMLVVCGSITPAPLAAEPQQFDLLGTWYVIVHYRDSGLQEAGSRSAVAGSRGTEAWEDKVWSFDRRRSRLLWVEYPVVFFDNDRGRYETLASGRAIKSPGSWRPGARQLEEIEKGLSVNPQWARSKSLRGDPARGFRSGGMANRESASVVGYSETWEVRGLADHPVFRRVDEMSSGRAVALDGQTEYRSTSRDTGRLEGSFSRDGVEIGSFVMMRSGPVSFDSQKGEREKWKK